MTKPSSTSPIILILIIALGLIVGYFYYSQANVDVSYDVPLPTAARDQGYIKFKNLKFDFAILQSKTFASLRTFGEFPVNAGVTGKKDLFSQ